MVTANVEKEKEIRQFIGYLYEAFFKYEEDRGRISIIEEKDIEYMLEKIFEGEFPQKKYMFGISLSD